MKEFYDILKVFLELIEQCGIDESKKAFSDIFEIADKDIKVENLSVTQEEYQQEGKRVLHEYFVDTLLS